MTLDEAIEHCEEVSKSTCGACGEDHRQLAEWLRELKQRRQADLSQASGDDKADAFIGTNSLPESTLAVKS